MPSSTCTSTLDLLLNSVTVVHQYLGNYRYPMFLAVPMRHLRAFGRVLFSRSSILACRWAAFLYFSWIEATAATSVYLNMAAIRLQVPSGRLDCCIVPHELLAIGITLLFSFVPEKAERERLARHLVSSSNHCHHIFHE